MPQTWVVDATPRQSSLPAAAVVALLDAGQCSAPAASLLAFINALVAVDHLTLVRYGRAPAPELVEGQARDPAAHGVPAHCFSIYRSGYWRSDAATPLADALRRESDSAITALQLRPADIRVAAWRRDIYERSHLADRLGFLYAVSRDEAFAINLYRDTAAGPFQPGEVERLLGIAPLLRQAHRGALRRRPDLTAAATLLQQRVPALSTRELAVCARIACGTGSDGIADALGIAPSTVATLRKRAYVKLTDAGLGSGRIALMRLVG